MLKSQRDANRGFEPRRAYLNRARCQNFDDRRGAWSSWHFVSPWVDTVGTEESSLSSAWMRTDPRRRRWSTGKIKGVLSRPRGAVVVLWRAVECKRKRLARAAGPSRRLAGGDWGGESGVNRPKRRRALLAPARRARVRAEAAARRCPRCWRGGSWSQRQRRASEGVSREARWAVGRGSATHAFGRGAGARRTARASPPVRENRLDHVTILDAGDDPKRPAAGRVALDVAAVDASQALCPADRAAPLGLGRFRLHLTVGIAALAAGTASGGRHAYPKGMKARYRLLGANTPWKHVRFTRGFGTRAARRAMKSSGSNTTWVVPSR